MTAIEIRRDKDREYYWKNVEKLRAKARAWRRARHEKYNAVSRKWNADNRARCRETTKAWRARNPDHLRQYDRDRRKNINFKIRAQMSSRLNEVLSYKGVKKAAKTMALIGCGVLELKAWLESKFTDGMSWDNYGQFGWHIDHKRPCASFDLTNPEQQRECFHYTNLQPLWWRDNIIKGDKWEPAAIESAYTGAKLEDP